MTILMMGECTPKQGAQKVPAIDLSNLDTTVSPKVDFYAYSTGGWQKNNPLSPEYARFGSFDNLRLLNETRLNELFASMAETTAEKGTVDQKISDIYKMALDSTRRNEMGAAPIKPYLERIFAAKDKKDLASLLAQMHLQGGGGFFGTGVQADLRNSDIQILYLGQGGLGLSDRDYYLDPKNKDLKEGYRAFMEKTFALAGLDNPKERSEKVLALEDALAKVSWSREQERDIMKQYNLYTTERVASEFPGFDFKRYFEGMGIPAQDKMVVAEPSYFKGFSDIFAKASVDDIKNYLASQIISGACSALDDDFYAAYFDFFSRQMSGVQQPQPRWKRAMRVPNSILSEAVGQMYVQKYFPESSKNMMIELVENLKVALSQHITELDWMSDETKAKAQEKLSNFTVKIGYPDKWKDYSTLDIDPSLSYYENLKRASEWYIQDNLSKLGKPTDKEEWGMSPQTVNAYYNPTTNEICFPAAILQPPFFNPDADAAVNYGGIGVVIGHEMSHGFDDQGRLFDKDGNMIDWWTEDDDRKFKEKAEVLASQFDAVEVVPGVHANGHFTMGENIGDHGGLSIAFTAMQNVNKGKNVPLIDGFTPEQRFYLSYGTIWAQNITPEESVRLTNLDPHSLAVNRVNVSIRNFQTFFDAFDIKEGDPMWRPESERVHIW